SEPMSPNYGMRRPSFENEHFEADDSESSRKPWMRSPKRNNTTPPRDKRRDFRSPKSGDDRLQTFGKSPTTVNSPHHSPSPPATVKGQSMTDKTSPSNRYFIVKCNSMKNLETSLNKGIWSTTPTNEQKFNQAFK
uniref:Probable ATP-dependent RNA helicase YTHDC2-like n=1 Tax=Saccoglossus kowalevskii TaxID=10224 RepID=A0ABM0N0M2_SACKO